MSSTVLSINHRAVYIISSTNCEGSTRKNTAVYIVLAAILNQDTSSRCRQRP